MDLDARTVNKIEIKRTVCTIKSETGAYSLAESANFESAMLDQSPIVLSAADRGKTKEVYRVSDLLHQHCSYYLVIDLVLSLSLTTWTT